MGSDPDRSVVDRWGRAHDVPNLFIIDGSIFTTGACINPTTTIQALALRTADYLKGEGSVSHRLAFSNNGHANHAPSDWSCGSSERMTGGPSVLEYQRDPLYLRYYPWEDRSEADARAFVVGCSASGYWNCREDGSSWR